MSWGKPGAPKKRRAKKKGLPTEGRNVEGVGYVVVLANGEQALRCRHCDAVVAVAGWWKHGTSEDPHLPVV